MLVLLGKNAAFQFFGYLSNLEEWAGQDELRGDTGVERQIVPIEMKGLWVIADPKRSWLSAI